MWWMDEIMRHDWMPHGTCIYWTPWLLWSRAIADSVIAFSYAAIPILLLIFTRRYGLQLKEVASMKLLVLIHCFAFFILLCGLTHVFDVITLWAPYYVIDATIRVFCAIASLGTVAMIWVYGRSHADEEWSRAHLSERLLNVADRLEKLVKTNAQ